MRSRGRRWHTAKGTTSRFSALSLRLFFFFFLFFASAHFLSAAILFAEDTESIDDLLHSVRPSAAPLRCGKGFQKGSNGREISVLACEVDIQRESSMKSRATGRNAAHRMNATPVTLRADSPSSVASICRSIETERNTTWLPPRSDSLFQ